MLLPPAEPVAQLLSCPAPPLGSAGPRGRAGGARAGRIKPLVCRRPRPPPPASRALLRAPPHSHPGYSRAHACLCGRRCGRGFPFVTLTGNCYATGCCLLVSANMGLYWNPRACALTHVCALTLTLHSHMCCHTLYDCTSSYMFTDAHVRTMHMG